MASLLHETCSPGWVESLSWIGSSLLPWLRICDGQENGQVLLLEIDHFRIGFVDISACCM